MSNLHLSDECRVRHVLPTDLSHAAHVRSNLVCLCICPTYIAWREKGGGGVITHDITAVLHVHCMCACTCMCSVVCLRKTHWKF